MFLLFIFIFMFAVNNVYSAKVSYCSSVHYNGAYTLFSDNTTLYTFSFDVNVTFNPDNNTFPNYLVITNFTNWSLNSSLYYLSDSYLFWYNGRYNFPCPSMKETCIYNFPNAKIGFMFDLKSNTTFVGLNSYEENYFYNGAVFDDQIRSTLIDDDGQESCIQLQPSCYDDNSRVNCFLKACCINVIEAEIPEDNLNDPCQEFYSETNITDSNNGNIKINFSAKYFIDRNEINITVTEFTSSNFNGNIIYEYGAWYCNGNLNTPFSNCSRSLPSSKNYRFVSNMEAQIIYNNGTYGIHYYVNIADINFQNGVFLKNNTIPFTPNDPFFYNSLNLPLFNNTQATTWFYCTKFKSGATIATQKPEIGTTPPLISTKTTTPSTATKKCLKYRSSTTVSDNSAYLEVEYILNSTTLFVDITNYFAAKFSTVQLEAYAFDIFSQTCRATTTQPNNQCEFKLSNNHKFELQMRTSLFPEGFNMLTIVDVDGQFLTPSLNSDAPCYSETNPYNYGNSKQTATTQFCCTYFI